VRLGGKLRDELKVERDDHRGSRRAKVGEHRIVEAASVTQAVTRRRYRERGNDDEIDVTTLGPRSVLARLRKPSPTRAKLGEIGHFGERRVVALVPAIDRWVVNSLSSFSRCLVEWSRVHFPAIEKRREQSDAPSRVKLRKREHA
jgi:hypothetical protein